MPATIQKRKTKAWCAMAFSARSQMPATIQKRKRKAWCAMASSARSQMPATIQKRKRKACCAMASSATNTTTRTTRASSSSMTMPPCSAWQVRPSPRRRYPTVSGAPEANTRSELSRGGRHAELKTIIAWLLDPVQTVAAAASSDGERRTRSQRPLRDLTRWSSRRGQATPAPSLHESAGENNG